MQIAFDRVSDTLYIDACEPYEALESDEIALGVIARTNPQTGEIENLEVMHLQKRLEAGEAFEIPVSLDTTCGPPLRPDRTFGLCLLFDRLRREPQAESSPQASARSASP